MKKGISTLIATVLILGFTVAIAAIIMVWGQGYISNIQKKAESTTNAQLACANDVLLDIVDVCNTNPTIFKVTLKNDGTKTIDKVILRFYEAPSTVKTYDTASYTPPGVGAFSIDSKTITVDGITGQVKLVEAIPVITIGSDQITCTSNVRKFGNFDNNQAWIKSC